MKLIVERDAFSAAISAAFRAARKGPDIPVLKNVLLKPNGKMLGIAATNLDMRGETNVPAEIDGDGSAITICGEALDHLVSKLPAGSQIRIEWDDDNSAIVQCGKSRYKLRGLPASDFPEFTLEGGDAVSFSIAAASFAAAMQAVRFAIGNDATRYYLNGIYLHTDDNNHSAFGKRKGDALVFVATTAFEFARFCIPLPKGAEDFNGVIIPGSSCDEIIRLCGKAEGDAEVWISPRLIRVSVGETTFTSKLIDATFPNYQNAVPANNDLLAKFDRETLAAALTRIVSLGDLRRAALSISTGEITVRAQSAEAGEAEEKMEAEYDGPAIDLGIKPRSFLATLEATPGETCALRFSENKTPLLFNQVTGDKLDYDRTFLNMLMEK